VLNLTSSNMKTKFTFIKALIITVISSISIAASAQTPIGPSVSSPYPSSGADMYVCAGGQITIKTPPEPNAATYNWYKKNSLGQYVQVQSSSSLTYTETAAGTGYYSYEVEAVSANGCVSPKSNPFNVYVLPPLTPTIAGTTELCATDVNNPTTLSLTASPNSSNSLYQYHYQWYKNGSPVGSDSPTYTETGLVANTYTYSVLVTYALDGNCSASASTTVKIDPIPAQPVITQ
jgi:hypothetical protein